MGMTTHVDVPTVATAPKPGPRSRRRLALAVLCVTLLMVSLDTTVLNDCLRHRSGLSRARGPLFPSLVGVAAQPGFEAAREKTAAVSSRQTPAPCLCRCQHAAESTRPYNAMVSFRTA